MNKLGWIVRQADWKEEPLSIKSVREIVFIQEQSVSETLEWDGHDKTAKHLLALDKKGAPIGTARFLSFGDQGQIGRMAVLKEHRGKGIGTALLKEALRLAKEEKLSSVFLNAQVHVISFYGSLGFSTVGNEFIEAGIPHQKMVKRLAV